MVDAVNHRTETPSGLVVECQRMEIADAAARLQSLSAQLDRRRGGLLSSGFEFPGRYTRWDVGFVDPPLCLSGRGRDFVIEALNPRGQVLLPACLSALADCAAVSHLRQEPERICGAVPAGVGLFAEEQRTRQPSLMTVLRCLREAFATPGDPHLGFYGAFGYDLVFQFESLQVRMQRDPEQRDLVLMLPDQLVVVDHQRDLAFELSYEFSYGGRGTAGVDRCTKDGPFQADAVAPSTAGDHRPGEYAEVVARAAQEFSVGNLFEVVPSQEFVRACPRPPSAVFAALRRDNPAPYGFLLNLGQGEYLVGASPEMFVRVRGTRVETCPIAGTIARGGDPIADAGQILSLLNSAKDEAELTMCTDVDRNDKARVCTPSSVRVIGRRQIELYSRLIHTVDHVEGELRPELDALDAFLTHCWAVTVTGAPKQAAMQFIEDHERSPRRFYGGAVGVIGLDGGLNTGLTLRTIHIRAGVAHVRAGATLLYASEPEAEERETELKAAAALSALDSAPPAQGSVAAPFRPSRPPVVLLVDHRDSFVHTLGDYFRQLSARVTTLRAGFDPAEIERIGPDLVVLSPGPGRPADFGTAGLLTHLARSGRPAFGVCLGLQALVEFAGGTLSVLATPRHGFQSELSELSGPLFAGLPARGLKVGRYHSLHGRLPDLPSCLAVQALAVDDGCLMACSHRELPFSAVQFHPESIMSVGENLGLKLLANVLRSTR